MKLDIQVQASSYSIREADPDDQWDIGEDGLEIHGVSLVRLPDDHKWGEEIDGQPGDPAVVLVEHYSDGCTFGSSEYAEVKGIFRSGLAAQEAAAKIPTDHGYFGAHISFKYFDVTLPA